MWFSRDRATTERSVVLMILDGWGSAPAWGGNAISAAHTPTFASLLRDGFHTTLEASGAAVGLPGHEQGNSEVGHLTIGAGRAIQQDRTRISAAIEDGSFFRNQTLTEAANHVKQHQSTLHLIGLVSSGGVHSHIDHLHALLEFCQRSEVTKVVIHAITDGRDVLPHTAAQELDRVRHWCTEFGVGSIGSVIGRYYAMDRDGHWDRIQRAYDLLLHGRGEVATSILAAVSRSYTAGLSDEFIEPATIDGSFAPIQSNDAVVFLNFRQDRARQLLRALSDQAFSGFRRESQSENLFVATMIPYWIDTELPGVHVIFPPERVNDTFGETLAGAGLAQLRIAESEKYAHVTYFLNGGREEPYDKEQRQLVPSKLTAAANQAPAMKTPQIAQAVVSALHKGAYRCIVANIASPDMVGHTGDFRATVTACEVVDAALGEIWQAAQQLGVVLVITADHGNAEQLVSPITNEPDTHHTVNPVPFVVIDPLSQFQPVSQPHQTLADVAPSVLTILGIPVPGSMRGHSLGTMNADRQEVT